MDEGITRYDFGFVEFGFVEWWTVAVACLFFYVMVYRVDKAVDKLGTVVVLLMLSIPFGRIWGLW